MNPCLADWNTEAVPMSSQKKPFGVDHDLVELLWQDGHVILHSQNHTNKKNENDDQTMMRRESGTPSNLIQENENMSSWLHNSGPIDDDPFEKEFCSNFSMSEFHSSNLIQTNNQFELNKICKFPNNHVVPNSQHSCMGPNPLPPPKYFPNSTKMKARIKNNGTTPPSNGQLKITKGINKAAAPTVAAMTVGSSHCGSNHVADKSRVSDIKNNHIVVGTKENYDVGKLSPQSDKETVEKAANTSSSGGSGSSFGVRTTYNQSTTTNSHKRKDRDDAEDSESPSEAAELESAAARNNKSGQRSGNTRRSRAAEVHNLSERRRRDRINEKMRALQELIPHSNKSDKASMLDEAIEYMKSLQLQLQMLWMGSGMAASMMFPSMQQHYLSRMGMSAAAMGAPPTMPSLPAMQSLHNSMHQQHLTRMPMLDQTMASPIHPTPNQAVLPNPINYPNQFNTPNFSDQYAAFLGFQQLQNAMQPMNMFNFGSHAAAQQNSNIAPPSHCNGPSA
ncbi:hypothetical protein Leryth_017062 [Lithospermum erythrorhizon]|uniref:DNA-binding transcription factor n=1 Tax=Lithospermum erythrorhizon TaxID=34254 RepID=A0AAV3PBP3_LITER|nr:hypothetical protein Leryth_017062 [Lithospermum erythrorhizon]